MDEKVVIALSNMSLSQKFYFQAVILPEIEYVIAKYSNNLLELGENEK